MLRHLCSFRTLWLAGVAAMIFLAGCLPAAHYKYDKKSAKDTLSIHPLDVSYLLMQKFADLPSTKIESLDSIMYHYHSRGGLITSAANTALGYAISATKTVIANEKGKYTATTNYGNTDDYFYAQPSLAGPFDPSGMQFTGFDVMRTIKREDGSIDTAMFATFEVDTSRAQEILNNFVFRLKLTKFWVRYVKPKVAMFSKRRMSVEFNISFLTALITPDGQMKDSVVLGKFHLLLNNISIRHGDPEFGLCENMGKESHEKESHEKEKRKDKEKEKGKEPQVTGKAFIVPRSYGYFKVGGKAVPGYNQGSYSIVVSMKECTKPNFTTRMIIENGSSLLDGAKGGASSVIPGGKKKAAATTTPAATATP
jgi:hypothetical protein